MTCAFRFHDGSPCRPGHEARHDAGTPIGRALVKALAGELHAGLLLVWWTW
jgi:hypothetical protein